MIKAFILICMSSMPQGDCTEHTALKVLYVPKVDSIQQCMFSAQVMLASGDMAPAPQLEYAKAVCSMGAHVAVR